VRLWRRLVEPPVTSGVTVIFVQVGIPSFVRFCALTPVRPAVTVTWAQGLSYRIQE
jgi:hypothetical protein